MNADSPSQSSVDLEADQVLDMNAQDAAARLLVVEEQLANMLRHAATGTTAKIASPLSALLLEVAYQSRLPHHAEQMREEVLTPELENIGKAIAEWQQLRHLSKR